MYLRASLPQPAQLPAGSCSLVAGDHPNVLVLVIQPQDAGPPQPSLLGEALEKGINVEEI